QIVSAGGSATSGLIEQWGSQTVLSGGTDSGTTVAGNLGVQLIGGSGIGELVSGVNAQQEVSGGTVTGAHVEFGTQFVSAGGTAISGVVSGNGGFANQFLFFGTDSGSLIGVSGSQDVELGGVASGTVVSGGTQTVSAGGSGVSGLIEATGVAFVSESVVTRYT